MSQQKPWLRTNFPPKSLNCGSNYEPVLWSYDVESQRSLLNLLLISDFTFSHSKRLKGETESHQGTEEVEGMKGKKNKNKDYCPALSAANPSSTPHKKHGFQWGSPALPVTPPHSGLDKLTQYGNTHSQAHGLSSVWPLRLSHSMKSALNWRHRGGGALVCFSAPLLLLILSHPFFMAPPTFGAHMRPLCRSMACG